MSISKGILHVFFLSDCYQHQFLETQIQGCPVDILTGSIFWTTLVCYSLGCLGVIVQQISCVCDWLREVLKLGAVPASRLSHARWTTTVSKRPVLSKILTKATLSSFWSKSQRVRRNTHFGAYRGLFMSKILGITTVNMFFTQGDILWVDGDLKWMFNTPT